MKLASLLLIIGFSATAARAVRVEVFDAWTDQPLAGVRVTVGAISARTDSTGVVDVVILPGLYAVIGERAGYLTRRDSVQITDGVALRLGLQPAPVGVQETIISAPSEALSRDGAVGLARSEVWRQPTPVADPVRAAKVLPGVVATNDFSTSYGVQGAGYQDNGLYVNGLTAPTLPNARRGLAEGRSIANPDLAQQTTFTAGLPGLGEADHLGGTMKVDYGVPKRSFWQATLALDEQRLVLARPGWMLGVRLADPSRLGQGLQTRGAYEMEFADLQLLAGRDIASGKVQVLGVVLGSRYTLRPASVRLRYNCQAPFGCDEFRGTGSGRERYGADFAAVAANWHGPLAAGTVRISGEVRRVEDEEATATTYHMRWFPLEGETTNAPIQSHESVQSNGRQTSVAANGRWRRGSGPRHDIVGVGMVRSYRSGTRQLEQAVSSSGFLESDSRNDRLQRQDTDGFLFFESSTGTDDWDLAGGARLLRVGSVGQTLWLPRLTLSRAMGSQTWLRLRAGRQGQGPGMAEILDRGATPLFVQHGWHGSLLLEGRQADAGNWRVEAFGRYLPQASAYSYEDMNVRYYPGRARVWAAGTTLWLHGRRGSLQGTASYGFLVARENVAGDGSGWRPRASDQRHTASLLLEDQMQLRTTLVQASRFHLRLLAGTGLPHTAMVSAADSDGLTLISGQHHGRRGRGYVRFDVGATQEMDLLGCRLEVREEVANLFDQFNVVGYRYLPRPDGIPLELRQGLGRRTFRLSITISLDGEGI